MRGHLYADERLEGAAELSERNRVSVSPSGAPPPFSWRTATRRLNFVHLEHDEACFRRVILQRNVMSLSDLESTRASISGKRGGAALRFTRDV